MCAYIHKSNNLILAAGAIILLASACTAGRTEATVTPTAMSLPATLIPKNPPAASPPTLPPASPTPTNPPPTATQTLPPATPTLTAPPSTLPAPVLSPAPNLPGGWQLVWSDEFDGPDGSPVDTSKWSFDIGGGGWGNAELECYTDSTNNAYQENGSLVIQALKQDDPQCPYTSARLSSRGHAAWAFGRFEVRAQLPGGLGIWPAVWLIPDSDTYGEWPSSGEIDIVELNGKYPGRVYASLHFGMPHKLLVEHYDLPQGTFEQDYHTFVLEWEPDEMRWYVDGSLYQAQSEWFTSSPNAKYPAPFDVPFDLMVNLAVGSEWPGYPDASTVFPKFMRVDDVRVYQK